MATPDDLELVADDLDGMQSPAAARKVRACAQEWRDLIRETKGDDDPRAWKGMRRREPRPRREESEVETQLPFPGGLPGPQLSHPRGYDPSQR